VVELPRLRLPLPERTGSDRDELRCPHGFVDRAYSVFLLRCVSANLTHQLQLRRLDVRPSPLYPSTLDAAPNVRAASLEAVKRGYEPPGAGSARHICHLHPGRRPAFLTMEVRKAARRWRCPTCVRLFRTREIPLPQQDLLPPSAREPECSRPVSGAYTLQPACQSRRRSEGETLRTPIPMGRNDLETSCQANVQLMCWNWGG